MNEKTYPIEELWHVLVQDPKIQSAIRGHDEERADTIIEKLRQRTALDNEDGEVYDLVSDAFYNEAETFEEYEAEQDKGAYNVVVRGVEGAYFVEAIEHDTEGVFTSLAEANSYAEANFGEFFTSSHDEVEVRGKGDKGVDEGGGEKANDDACPICRKRGMTDRDGASCGHLVLLIAYSAGHIAGGLAHGLKRDLLPKLEDAVVDYFTVHDHPSTLVGGRPPARLAHLLESYADCLPGRLPWITEDEVVKPMETCRTAVWRYLEDLLQDAVTGLQFTLYDRESKRPGDPTTYFAYWAKGARVAARQTRATIRADVFTLRGLTDPNTAG